MIEETAAGRVARTVRESILVGRTRPGTTLSQADIAAEQDAGQMDVRDALHVLASEGLVDIGATVAVVREPSTEEMRELYELRELVEPKLTSIAVPHVGPAEIAKMTALAETMESTSEPREWLRANAEFHALVYTRADRPRMIELTEQLRRLTDRYLYLHVSDFRKTERLHVEHRAILEAVSNGDAAQAAELTRHHIVGAYEAIRRYLGSRTQAAE